MSSKPELLSLDALVSEALERMRLATAAGPCYDVDRTSGQWIVRRASTTNELFAADVAGAAIESTLQST